MSKQFAEVVGVACFWIVFSLIAIWVVGCSPGEDRRIVIAYPPSNNAPMDYKQYCMPNGACVTRVR